MTDEQKVRRHDGAIYLLRAEPANNKITLEYDPKKMLNPVPGAHKLNKERYANALRSITRRIDWCMRKSYG